MLIVVEDAPARGGAGGRESYRQNEGYVSFIKVKLSYIVKFFFSNIANWLWTWHETGPINNFLCLTFLTNKMHY